jgi:hypothetical protein
LLPSRALCLLNQALEAQAFSGIPLVVPPAFGYTRKAPEKKALLALQTE